MIQRRIDGSRDFHQDWNTFKEGFGNASGEYWIGNDYLHYLTSTRSYTLRIELEDWDNERRYAAYSSFAVASEADKYRLTLGSYTGTVSADETVDTTSGFLYHNNAMFSTYDQDNDSTEAGFCIGDMGYGGFWHQACTRVCPNNNYCRPSSNMCGLHNNVRWDGWHGAFYSLKTFVMMIRPA